MIWRRGDRQFLAITNYTVTMTFHRQSENRPEIHRQRWPSVCGIQLNANSYVQKLDSVCPYICPLKVNGWRTNFTASRRSTITRSDNGKWIFICNRSNIDRPIGSVCRDGGRHRNMWSGFATAELYQSSNSQYRSTSWLVIKVCRR